MKNSVNDFVIKLANVNGTGSASANNLLMKCFFRMGIPVMGKNYFPSNIQGLPTWYEVRVTKDGYVARSGRVDIMVAMNAQTYAEDLAEVSPGGYLIYDSTWPRQRQLSRDDITVLGIPLSRMCNETFPHARTRILMKNVAYVGALVALLQIDMKVIKGLLADMFGAKEHLIAANLQAIQLGYDYASENFECPLPMRVESMDANGDAIMIDGNTAAALGCLYAGATVGAWYPITPSTSLMDGFKNFCERYRVDEQGKKKFCIIQAEDELAAIGMVLGASWCGARAFTPTSGPGISLMNEFIGYAYYAELPAVIFDVQRVGPSTGMPTRTQQGDIMAAAYASHGDTKHVVLFPANPEDCFYLAAEAFELADRLQTPVFVLSDLDIGMNDWMCPALKWDPDFEPDRGKVLHADDLEKMDKFYRYVDTDNDGICYRTLPGEHPKGAYFTRGSGHNRSGVYTEDSDEYQDVLDRLTQKHNTAAEMVPKPVIRNTRGAKIGIISLGSCDGAILEARDELRAQGVKVSYMRIRAFPFGKEVDKFISKFEQILVVEQNRDAQLRSLLLLESNARKEQLISCLHYGGFPLASAVVVDAIVQRSQSEAAA